MLKYSQILKIKSIEGSAVPFSILLMLIDDLFKGAETLSGWPRRK